MSSSEADRVIELTVNGQVAAVEASEAGESLLYLLRERLGLSGSKNACEQGECGSCSVLLDGELVCACLVLASAATGCDVVTVEGLSHEPGVLTDVQQAFVAEGAIQCGFCTPGLVLAVHQLLERNPAPTELDIREAISGNLCRCTGYGRVVAAVWSVLRERAGTSGERVTTTGPAVLARRRGGIGQNATRPDALAKVSGRFAFSSDLHADRMLWAHILRSPHSHAAITSVDTSPALAIPGVAAVLTAADVPGCPLYGSERADQPVFAADVVRFHGEPIAAVAADHPAVARRAAEAIRVTYQRKPPLLDAEAAIEAEPIHPDGNVFQHLTISTRPGCGTATTLRRTAGW
jgi:aerobic-type carbon monoxide dehydrogenase small subunit (CoxS/CutS family)